MARTSSSLRTSVLINSASEPRERSSLTSALPASSRRPATTTFAPFLAKATAAARPMPVKAPVINTTGLLICDPRNLLPYRQSMEGALWPAAWRPGTDRRCLRLVKDDVVFPSAREKDFVGWRACLEDMESAMELRHLRYFIAVAEEGSLTLAAEKRLHTAQPSLSRQIRDLEYEVGVQLMSRSVHGIELTVAGKAFLDHARLALAQVDAATEAARRAAQPGKKSFAIGFQTGHEMNWLPQAMHVLHDELKNIDVTVSSDYSPDLAEAIARGRLDLAFLRAEPDYDLEYRVVDREPLIVLMPSDHRLTARDAIRPQDFVGEIFIGGANKASVLRAVTEDYLGRSGLDIKPD